MITGRISGIKRMEIHDGHGIRTTVFFKGCPLRCLWCHNPESLSFEKQIAFFEHKCVQCGLCRNERNEDTATNCPTAAQLCYGQDYTVAQLVEILMQDAPFFEGSNGGVTLSGGECLAQPAFATKLAKTLQEQGVSVYVDTCGFVKRESLQEILPYTDTFLYDIKAIDPILHKQLTGQDNTVILDNLRFLSEQGATIEIRYPLVMGYNDGECQKIGAFLKGLSGIAKVKVLRYHALAASRYTALGMQSTLPNTHTTENDVIAAVRTLEKCGLRAEA